MAILRCCEECRVGLSDFLGNGLDDERVSALDVVTDYRVISVYDLSL